MKNIALVGVTIGFIMMLGGLVAVSYPLHITDMHKTLINSVPQILRNDGYDSYADIYDLYLHQIENGSESADYALSPSEHFFNPYTLKGLGGFKSSAVLATEYFNLSVYFWREGNRNLSMFYMGFLLHLIQDSTVPQHAIPSVLDGHLEYESWFFNKSHRDNYLTATTGDYSERSVFSYIQKNAIISLGLSQYAMNEATYPLCAQVTVPLAQATSAGVFVLTLEYSGEINLTQTIDQGMIGLVVFLSGGVIAFVSYRVKK